MSLWSRLSRRRRDADLEEELRAHLRMAVEDRIARGESAVDAGRSARREFGNELVVREATRNTWGWAVLERFGKDLTYALRQIRRSPGFSAITVLTLALGLGSTTAIFSVVNSVLLEPMNYRDPGRLYAGVNLPSPRSLQRGNWLINARHFSTWRSHCSACQDVALGENTTFTLTGWGEPRRDPAMFVSSNFFRTLGIQPALGRDFRPEEELPGEARVLILSDSLWRSEFNADPAVIGRTLMVNGYPHRIVGVMPPDFRLPAGRQWGIDVVNQTPQPLLFRPLGVDVSREYGDGKYNYVSLVRLKPGRQPAEAVAEFRASITEFVRQFHIGLRPALLPLQEVVTRSVRGALWLLLGAVAAVLLIVCVNIGNLMLVRTASRDREAGIRMALGSSRAELFRLVLTEALLLVAAGSGAGVLLAELGLKAFIAAAPIDLPRLGDVHMDARVLIFAFGAGLVSTLLCGLVPAWRLAQTDPNELLKSGAANATQPGRKLRFRELLVTAEVALSTLLLVIGGLLAVSFYRVMQAPKGFDVEHVITQDISLVGPKYTDPARIGFMDEALRLLAGIRGVRSVGITNELPLRGESWICDLRDIGPPAKPAIGLANFRFVNSGYWAAMGIPVEKGRLLEAADRNRHAAVISERAAQALWPGQNPLGRRVGSCGGEAVPQGSEVVGVVGEVRADLEKNSPFTVYQPYWTTNNTRFSLVLRTRADPAAVIGDARVVLRSLDPDLPFTPAATMEQVLDESVGSRRFQTVLVVGFAGAALLLAALGIYGVISFTVARRTPEIGVRIALGARGPQLVALVVRQGMTPVILGLAAGLAGALAAGRLVASQLFGISADDPLAFSAVAALLAVVALCACWIPARRATRIDPLSALRCE